MQGMFRAVKSWKFGMLFETPCLPLLSQRSTDFSRLQQGFGHTLVGKISAFPGRCWGAVSAFPLRFAVFRHRFLSFSGGCGAVGCGCACVGRSPLAQGSGSLGEPRFGVRMCLPELITVVFYTAPYQQLQRELLSKASPCRAFSGPHSGMFFSYLQVVPRMASLRLQMSAASQNLV